MGIWIEKAPSNRAKCRSYDCGQLIKKGELRIGEDGGSGLFPHYSHIKCWLRKHVDFLKDLMNLLDVDCWTEEYIQTIIEKAINKQ